MGHDSSRSSGTAIRSPDVDGVAQVHLGNQQLLVDVPPDVAVYLRVRVDVEVPRVAPKQPCRHVLPPDHSFCCIVYVVKCSVQDKKVCPATGTALTCHGFMRPADRLIAKTPASCGGFLQDGMLQVLEQVGDADAHLDVQGPGFDRCWCAGLRNRRIGGFEHWVRSIGILVHVDRLDGQDGLASCLGDDVRCLAGTGHGEAEGGELGLFECCIVDFKGDAADRVGAIVSDEANGLAGVVDVADGDRHGVVHVVAVEDVLPGRLVPHIPGLKAVSGGLDVFFLDARGLDGSGDLAHDGVVLGLGGTCRALAGKDAEVDARDGGFDRDLAGAGNADCRNGRRRVSHDGLSGAEGQREGNDGSNGYDGNGLQCNRCKALLHGIPPVLRYQNVRLLSSGKSRFMFTARTVGVPGKFPGSVMLETQKFPVSHVEQAPSTKLFMPCVFGGSRGTEYTAYRFLEDTIDSCIARRFVVHRRYLMLHKRSMFALIPLGILVAFFAGCASKTTPTPVPVPLTGGNNITVTAAGMAFDTNSITVSAGAHVTITFQNNDSGIPHNIAFYTSTAATTIIYQGARTTGVSTVTYTFDAPTTPGTYFFRCDVHPTTMTGDFIVQ